MGNRTQQHPASPVPSDARLWPGEKPFTAFGQFGKGNLDLRVFDQDIWWVDINGTPHRLDQMTLGYQSNVIMFLREHAEGYHTATIMRACLQTIRDTLTGREPLADLNPNRIADQNPYMWIESTPLLKKLRQLTETAPPD